MCSYFDGDTSGWFAIEYKHVTLTTENIVYKTIIFLNHHHPGTGNFRSSGTTGLVVQTMKSETLSQLYHV
jgi:hypothetical protein